METLLNFVWLMLGLSLIAVWSIRARRTETFSRGLRKVESLPPLHLQLTAILLLVILLFPVISLTDDMAMCTAPRDAERALRLNDSLDHAQPAAVTASVAAWVEIIAAGLGEGPGQPIEQQPTLTGLLAGIRPAVDSRPPPCA